MTEASMGQTTGRMRLVCERVVQTARLMVGVPDYQTYVTHRQTNASGPAGHDLSRSSSASARTRATPSARDGSGAAAEG